MKVIKNVDLYGKIVDIAVENGKIKEIGKDLGDGTDFGGNRIYPGLIDIHSHGCMNMEATDPGAVEKMVDIYLESGTTTWYPTTSTCSKEELYAATQANISFDHGANVPGFHMEGPFINPMHRGAQNPDYITSPKLQWILDCPQIKRVSLAPEIPGSKNFIENCPIQVSIGHTDTDYDTALGAFRCGANSLTHTFNAMNGIHHRAPGPIGAAADSGEVYCELICDGFHIHPSVVRMLIKIMGDDKIILISDMVRSAGLPDGNYTSGGLNVTVKDGKTYTEDGHIAGSTTTLFGCVKCAIKFGISPERAVKMASENPAKLMGLNKGKIEVGYDADFIIVDEDFNLIKAIARGEF